MIQYKLIKEYPGSPRLGTIEWYDRKDCETSILSTITFSDNWAGKNFYNSHPQFWQKVEELDYEILQLIGKDGTIISKIGYTFPECFQTLVNAKDTFDIFSVKRLSDGEVFTVGDLIDFGGFMDKGIEPIERFEVDYFDKKQISAYNSAFGLGFQIWKKAPKKTPLFTTEDGVEIFKGDKFSVVQLSTFHQINNCSYPLTNAIDWKCFSTKESAEEYILLNKPLLSLNDLLYVWGVSAGFPYNPEHYKTAPLFKSFEKLAQSKL